MQKKLSAILAVLILNVSGATLYAQQSASAMGISVDTNANIIAGGSLLTNNISNNCYVARFTNAGIVDDSFGTNGMALLSIGSSVKAQACTVQPDNQILLAAGGVAPGSNSLYVCRFTTAGVLDSTFGGSGMVSTLLGSVCSPCKILVQPDNKIVVVGTTSLNNASVILLIRYNSNGSLDTSFGNTGSGIVLQGYTASLAALNAIFDGSGNILVSAGVSSMSGQWVVLARFTSQGILDSTFGTAGFVGLSAVPFRRADGLVLQTNGQWVLAGVSLAGDVILTRCNADGSLDSSFGVSGIVDTELTNMAGAYTVNVQSDGNIVAAGTEGGCFLVLRYLSNGTLDTSYADNGVLTVCITNSDGVSRSVLNASGEAIVFGRTSNNATIACVTTAGALDDSFGNEGLVNIL
jgi:uncharacterized delta-60 repeat protein